MRETERKRERGGGGREEGREGGRQGWRENKQMYMFV